MKKFAPAVLISFLFSVLGSVVYPSTSSAMAASCRNAGGSQSSFHYSSQIDGSVFTICGKTVALKIKQKVVVTKTDSSSQPKPKPKPKPTHVAPTKVKVKVKVKRKIV
jgi:hypothetical protein